MVEGGGIITMGDANLPREMARPEWLKGQGRGEESLCLGTGGGRVLTDDLAPRAMMSSSPPFDVDYPHAKEMLLRNIISIRSLSSYSAPYGRGAQPRRAVPSFPAPSSVSCVFCTGLFLEARPRRDRCCGGSRKRANQRRD